MAELSEEAEQKINQLQVLEQGVQNMALQKQQFQAQLMEIESALNEVDKTKEAFKIVGNIMVHVNKEDVKKELDEKKDTLGLRIKTIEKQETNLREKAKKLQEDVMDQMKDGSSV